MKDQFKARKNGRAKAAVITGREVRGADIPAIAISDDDFEEYEEFLAWKKKYGLRATLKRLAGDRYGSDDPNAEAAAKTISDNIAAKNKLKKQKAVADETDR